MSNLAVQGTPAARMKKIRSTDLKKHSCELTTVFESFSPCKGMKVRLRGYGLLNLLLMVFIWLAILIKRYIQVLVIAPESMLGTSTDVKITSLGRWSVFGEVIETSSAQVKLHTYKGNINLEAAPCQDSYDSCECSREPEPCPCAVQNLGQQISNCGHEEALCAIVINSSTKRNHIGGDFINTVQSMLLRKRKLQGPVKVNDVNANKFLENQETRRMGGKLATMDCVWLSGIIVCFLTTIALLILLSSRMLSS